MNKPIKVLDLRDSPWVDGPGRTVLDCASTIDQNVCQIVIGGFVGEDGTSTYVAEAINRKIDVERIFEKGAFDFRVIGQILEIIDRRNIDLVHTHDFRTNVLGLYCAKKTGLPLVSTCHGWIANDFRGRCYTAIDKVVLRNFDAVITVSHGISKLLEKYGIPADKMFRIPNALVMENYERQDRGSNFRKELGVPDDVKVIANIGRLSKEKGQVIFVHAAQEVLAEYDDVYFLLVGKGSDEDQLRALVEAKGLSERIRFAGFRSDMKNVYSAVDAIVQSSFTEGMPNVVLEALALGIPVIASDVGGTREVLDEGRAGVLVTPGAVDELALMIRRFLDHPNKNVELSRHGSIFVRNNFDHRSRVARLCEVYRGLLPGGRIQKDAS